MDRAEAALEPLRRCIVEGTGSAGELLRQGSPSASPPVVDAVALAARTAHAWARGGRVAEEDARRAAALAGRDERADEALALLCVLGERAAVLAFDADALTAWADLHRRVAGAGPEHGLRLQLASAWLELLRGPVPATVRRAAELGDACRAARLGDAVVEAQVVRALASLGVGEVSDGLDHARRACRMARAEAVPHQEILAHLVLARARRVSGTPHLASRVLRSLAPLAPRPSVPWLAWELAFVVGAHDSMEITSDAPLAIAARALTDLLGCAAAGDAAAFAAALDSASAHVGGFLDAWVELNDLSLCLDVDGDVDRASPTAADWVRGLGNPQPPHGILGAGGGRSSSEEALAFVAAAPGEPARRVLAVGVPLCRTPDAVVVDRSTRPQERTDSALAMLLLAPGDVDERGFFRELYGFDFDPPLHKQVLDSLVHRIRRRAGSAAELTRGGGRIGLHATHRALVWDPRCQRPLAAAVLDALARSGPMTARQTTAEVGAPLRTVQAALKEMTDDEDCVPRKEGRRLTYEVEDTAFSELTRARFTSEEP